MTRKRMEDEMQDYFKKYHERKKEIHSTLINPDSVLIDRHKNPELWYENMMQPKIMNQNEVNAIRSELESEEF